jgi:rfaE bifunctional protein nucleotidyltransferase chain/domain
MRNHKDKIYNLPELVEYRNDLRKSGKKVIFTNGVFDILHRGHVIFLESARELGDFLIVGVNSDDSVHQIKGPDRPIHSETDRLAVVSALECVDAVIKFDEDTPINMIKNLIPDILVKGSDYSIEQIVGADFILQMGGEVRIIPLVQGISTTGIIHKILNKRNDAKSC